MACGSKILNKYAFKTQASVAKINKILTILSDKALCRHEISKEIHVNYRHTKNYIDYLLAEKKIYISAWRLENKGERTMYWPYYRTGDKKSKPKPANLTQSEKSKRYRKKLSKDEDRLERINRNRRLKRVTIKPDWTASWMMASSMTMVNADGA